MQPIRQHGTVPGTVPHDAMMVHRDSHFTRHFVRQVVLVSKLVLTFPRLAERRWRKHLEANATLTRHIHGNRAFGTLAVRPGAQAVQLRPGGRSQRS
eukprot:scaffold376856_cov40-Prasinocladus_malaysianus.AAC.1